MSSPVETPRTGAAGTMTIFRAGGVLASILLAACGLAPSNYPDANTALGRIVRIGNFQQAAAELKRFTEAGLGNPAALRAEFLAAGFEPSTYRDEHGATCQSFRWQSNDIFPIVMLANICGREVFTNAGQTAP